MVTNVNFDPLRFGQEFEIPGVGLDDYTAVLRLVILPSPIEYAARQWRARQQEQFASWTLSF